jgi:chaperone modulatory protein CbpM
MDDTTGPARDGIVVEEHIVFSFEELCRASGAASVQLQALVDEGLLYPTGRGPQDWRFAGPSLATARTALRLTRELGVELASVALVMDLLAEIALLRARLRTRR